VVGCIRKDCFSLPDPGGGIDLAPRWRHRRVRTGLIDNEACEVELGLPRLPERACKRDVGAILPSREDRFFEAKTEPLHCPLDRAIADLNAAARQIRLHIDQPQIARLRQQRRNMIAVLQ